MNISSLVRSFTIRPTLLPPLHSTLPSSSRTAAAAAENAVSIKCSNLNYSIGKRRRQFVPILMDCSFLVPSGRLWMLLGPNGCGKSTHLKILAGFLKPTNGNVYIKRPKSFVFQNPDHQVMMPPVEDDVTFGLGKLNLTPNEAQSKVSKVLDALGMSNYLQRPVQTLSGGQKQRVAIAGALAEACKVLLLDELITFLDESDGALYMEDGNIVMQGDGASILDYIKTQQSLSIDRINS